MQNALLNFTAWTMLTTSWLTIPSLYTVSENEIETKLFSFNIIIKTKRMLTDIMMSVVKNTLIYTFF